MPFYYNAHTHLYRNDRTYLVKTRSASIHFIKWLAADGKSTTSYTSINASFIVFTIKRRFQTTSEADVAAAAIVTAIATETGNSKHLYASAIASSAPTLLLLIIAFESSSRFDNLSSRIRAIFTILRIISKRFYGCRKRKMNGFFDNFTASVSGEKVFSLDKIIHLQTNAVK